MNLNTCFVRVSCDSDFSQKHKAAQRNINRPVACLLTSRISCDSGGTSGSGHTGWLFSRFKWLSHPDRITSLSDSVHSSEYGCFWLMCLLMVLQLQGGQVNCHTPCRSSLVSVGRSPWGTRCANTHGNSAGGLGQVCALMEGVLCRWSWDWRQKERRVCGSQRHTSNWCLGSIQRWQEHSGCYEMWDHWSSPLDLRRDTRESVTDEV